MCRDLMLCKRKAAERTKSNNPPRLGNGRKKGYMRIMKELWDQLEYENLGFTQQNLRDQAGRLGKTLGSVTEVIDV